jgi:hypothetical protein
MLTVFTGGIFSNAKEAKISQEFLVYVWPKVLEHKYTAF